MTKATDRRKWVHRRVVPWERVEIPQASLNFAMERVSYLEGRSFKETLNYLLACAYLQGINDCVEAHIRNPQIAVAVGERENGK